MVNYVNSVQIDNKGGKNFNLLLNSPFFTAIIL